VVALRLVMTQPTYTVVSFGPGIDRQPTAACSARTRPCKALPIIRPYSFCVICW